jgi:hypothetical protein
VADDEVIVLIASVILALACAPFVLGWLVHRLYLRDNPAAALPLLGIVGSVAWSAYVLWYHADPSVTGVYTLFYFILGLALVLGPGFWPLSAYGLRVTVDVMQRRNMAVAIVIGAFVFSTGLIYGGSNWGEADPVGDEEGGWWIPLGFFLAGWLALLVVAVFYLRGEPRSLRLRLVQDRSRAEARSAAAFLISTALVLTHAVAGDFWGWAEGLLGVGAVVLMMITHDLCRRAVPTVLSTVESSAPGFNQGRYAESLAYLLISLAFWGLSYAVAPVR